MGTVLAPATSDVIDLLVDQHREIREAMAVLMAAPPAGRLPALRALAELIEEHEDVEAWLLHPLAEQRLPAGDTLAHDLVVAENRADELLGQLLAGPDEPRFSALLGDFRTVILDHLRREERDEFAPLRARVPAAELVELAVRARENRDWL